jgi:maltose alpha-D-glucosyltransferase/alpha-amylase
MNRSVNWWQKAVIYELYVDKFAGNFSGLTSKLDYISRLGVDTIWLLPHYPSPLVDDGYDISDYQNIRSDLGSLADFDRFLSAAHDRGLKVIIDLVLNHTSDQHAWFKASRSSRDNPKRNWYLWNDNKDKFRDAFVHFSQVKDSNWIWNESTGDFYYATFYPQQPDLNWDNPEVVAAMTQTLDFWLDRGVDGFRLDAIARLIKRDGTNCFALPEAHEALKKLRAHIDSKYPNILLMAESGGWVHEAKPFFGSGDECQLVINFPLAVKMLAAVTHKNLSGIDEIWQQSGQLPEGCSWAVFLTNHDSVDLFFLTGQEERSALAGAMDPHNQFIQPDSASFGARLAEVCQGNQSDILWATQLQLSQPGTPVIYYGNEIGMRNAVLPEKPVDTRLYVRGNFDWSEAERQQSDPSSLLSKISDLLRQRRGLSSDQT